jgi:glycerophosphoryl diester phosphodiesterase
LRFSPQIRQLEWLVKRPIAHRGLHEPGEGVIENTATAFQQAIEHRYPIECDIQLTEDGEAIVFHDETLDRLTDESGLVASRTASALQKIPIVGSTDRCQLLPELLDQVAGKVPIIIEIKSHWNGDTRLAVRAAQVLEDYAGPYAFMSFDPDIVACLAATVPHVVRGIVADRVHDPYYQPLPLARRFELRTMSHLARTKPHFVSFDYAGLPFAPIQQIRSQGFPVITWTIKSERARQQARKYSDQVTFEGFLPI